MPYIISVLLFLTHEHIITHQQFVFAWTMLISHIIQVLLFISHKLILFFLINTFSPHFGWLTLCSFSSYFFYLVLLSFSLASIQLFHPTHGLFCFIVLPLLGLHIFPSCSSHTVNTFFYVLAPGIWLTVTML